MKRLLISAAVVAALGFAAPAFAQVTGTVTVTGNVTTACSVVTGGSGSTFSGTIPLGELDQSNGTLSTTLSGSTSGSPAGTPASFQINCNGSDATVSLSATELATGSGSSPGYSRIIDYTAEFDGALAAGGVKTITYNTVGLPAPTPQNLGGRLANAPGNVVIKVWGLSAQNGPTSLLEAGAYASTINVSITPIT